MNDLLPLTILLACLALTFGLVRLCSSLVSRENSSQIEGKP
ncbi:MAG: hypothetical protein AB7G11_16225 [Phycisphaerales bacterium]